MAITTPIEWEIREDGDPNNGGGFSSFVPSPGTDYSQQASAAVSGSDLEIDTSNAYRIRSASGLINDSHVGNIINITGGTGFNVGRYLIYQSAGGGWYDVEPGGSAVGTTGSTGGSFVLGGALGFPTNLADLNTILSNFKSLHGFESIDGNIIWIRSGTYTLTGIWGPSSDLQQNGLELVGYYQTRGDLTGRIFSFDKDHTKRPLINVSFVGASDMISVSRHALFANLRFVNGSTSNVNNLFNLAWYSSAWFHNCYFDFSAKAPVQNIITSSSVKVEFHGCEFINCKGIPITTDDPITLVNCIFKSTSTQPYAVSVVMPNSTNTHLNIESCAFDGYDKAISIDVATGSSTTTTFTAAWIQHCVFRNNNIGLYIKDRYPQIKALNCIFEGNTTAIQLDGTVLKGVGKMSNLNYLAFYNNTNDILPDNRYLGTQKFTLSQSALTDPSNNDYTTADSSLFTAGVVGDVIGLAYTPTIPFKETLKATRDHHWRVDIAAIAQVNNGRVDGMQNNRGAVRGATGTSALFRFDVSGFGSHRIIAVSENSAAITRAILANPFAPFIRTIYNKDSFSLSHRRVLHRVVTITSKHFTFEIRSGRWNVFKHTLTDDVATSAGGAWDQSTDTDKAATIEQDKVDIVAHPTKTSPGRITYHIGGNVPKSKNYPSRGLF